MKLLRSILLEGPDGAGKSTLYVRMTGTASLGWWDLRSTTHDRRNPLTAADAWQQLAMFAADAPCISDRSVCVSELVLIYCRPSTEAILKTPLDTLFHNDQAFVDAILERREMIIRIYDDVIEDLRRGCNLDYVLYDWTKDLDAEVLREVLIEKNICAA